MQFNKTMLALVFCAGYIVSDLLNDMNISYMAPAQAEVAGMDYFDLRTDYDFKKAVRHVVEDCDVSGYVDGGYLYSTEISC